MTYTTLSEKEKQELLNTKDSRRYNYVGHSWVPIKGVGKMVCKSCGLVALRNPLTDWCVDKGCNYDVHSSYKHKVKTLTRRIG